jgi:hypothetical protein
MEGIADAQRKENTTAFGGTRRLAAAGILSFRKATPG